MQQTIKSFQQLLVLKASPEDLPFSRVLLAIILISFFLLNLSLPIFPEKVPLDSLAWAYALSIGLSIGLIYVVLMIKKMTVRLNKLLLAMFGVDLFFLLLSLLLLPLGGEINVLVGFITMVWSLMIKTHIFSLGFSIKKLPAFFMVINYEIIRGLPLLPILLPLIAEQRPV